MYERDIRYLDQDFIIIYIILYILSRLSFISANYDCVNDSVIDFDWTYDRSLYWELYVHSLIIVEFLCEIMPQLIV